MASQDTLPAAPRRDAGIAERFMAPLARMRSNVDHLFEDFPSRLSAFQFIGAPAVEMTEAEDSYKIAVEVPGIQPADIDLEVDRDMLIIKGEKKDEHREENREYVISERSYGAFERRIAIPADGLSDDISAETSNGVLHISIPRSPEAASERRRIEIRKADNA